MCDDYVDQLEIENPATEEAAFIDGEKSDPAGFNAQCGYE